MLVQSLISESIFIGLGGGGWWELSQSQQHDAKDVVELSWDKIQQSHGHGWFSHNQRDNQQHGAVVQHSVVHYDWSRNVET